MKEIKVIIYSENEKFSQKMESVIISEAKRFNDFNVRVISTNNMKDLNKSADLVIILLTKSTNIKTIQKLTKTSREVIVDTENGIIKTNNKIEKNYSKFDIAAMGFSIIYDYYNEKVK